jgi:sterol desaturase/sphingolipid hydroxylase (fatty acid hydroxylase superfamily)
MKLSKWSYRADFAVYPPMVGAAAVQSLAHAGRVQFETGLAAAAVGVFAWTAIEYALHRWVLHRIEPFRRMHAAHHEKPTAFIGTPVWLSAALFLGTWATLAAEFPRSVSGGLAAGLMLGYLAYTAIHDAVHHRRARPGSWLQRTKLRHALHHRPGPGANFGVSTALWDRVMGTAAMSAPSRGPSAQ